MIKIFSLLLDKVNFPPDVEPYVWSKLGPVLSLEAAPLFLFQSKSSVVSCVKEQMLLFSKSHCWKEGATPGVGVTITAKNETECQIYYLFS